MGPTASRYSDTGPGINNQDNRCEVLASGVLFALGLLSFVLYARTMGTEGTSLIASTGAFMLLFLPYAALGVKHWANRLAVWVSVATRLRASLLVSLPVIVYLGYAGATGTFELTFLCKYALYAGVPLWLLTQGLRAAGQDPFQAPLQFTLVLLILWLPIDFEELSEFRLPGGVPQAPKGIPLMALDLALFLFVTVAPVRDLGFTFHLTRRDLAQAGLALISFGVAAIPLGLGIGFIHYGWRPFEGTEWALLAFYNYFYVAIPEEFLFRGLLQNLLEKCWPGPGGPWVALLIASLLFGAAHLNNPPVPNLRYALLASMAGLAYGWVWLRTRKVTASALTHGAVDWIWTLGFRGG